LNHEGVRSFDKVMAMSSEEPDLIIRRATDADLAALGQLGALLVRTHYDFDRRRFMAPGSDPEGGYAWFLGTQLTEEDTAILVAEQGGAIVGYVYAVIEPQSWKELREEAGFIHDIVVAESGRGRGVASRLMDAAILWMRTRGMPRVMLFSAHANVNAHRLFERLGFRKTMVEMTREL
jgi:ribosomal protein S18 acetylase RimI-like enzyme